MIKVYCDKCGKEITNKVNNVEKTVEATDIYGATLVEWTKVIQMCDECHYNDLTCGFKVGDEVITSTGQVGKITDICDCDNCKERGFYEPSVEVEIGSGSVWITNNDKKVNFASFYKIGDQVFGNLDEQCVLDDIKRKKEEIYNMKRELIELEAQLNVVKVLKNN